MKLSFPKKLLAAAACIAAIASPLQAAEKVYKLKMAETWPSNFPIFGDAPRNMAEMAEKMANGRLKITIDSKNKHKAPFGIFDMVRSG